MIETITYWVDIALALQFIEIKTQKIDIVKFRSIKIVIYNDLTRYDFYGPYLMYGLSDGKEQLIQEGLKLQLPPSWLDINCYRTTINSFNENKQNWRTCYTEEFVKIYHEYKIVHVHDEDGDFFIAYWQNLQYTGAHTLEGLEEILDKGVNV